MTNYPDRMTRPLTTWPHPETVDRGRSPFTATWSATVDLLDLTGGHRPANRQGRPRKWGDHCWECRRPVQMQWMRQGLCPACYQRNRRAGTMPNTYVDPAPAREHLAAVYATGVSYRWIAKQAGTSTVNVNHVAKGTRNRISGELAAKILSVPVPETTDEDRLKRRLLQTAGIRGVYVGVQRRYKQARAARGVPRRRRDPNRHALGDAFRAEREAFLAQFDAEREEFMRWLYEGMPGQAIVPTPAPSPAARSDQLAGLACGECERCRCVCGATADHDLWISILADHDEMCGVAIGGAA